MTKVYNLSQISTALEDIDAVTCIEEGFIAYSRDEVVVPPVGEMLFEDPRGEAHIKYGFIKENDYFVVKIASGFYENFRFGLPTNSGLMLLFSQKPANFSPFCSTRGNSPQFEQLLRGRWLLSTWRQPRCIASALSVPETRHGDNY